MTKVRIAVLAGAVVLLWAILPGQAAAAPVRCGDTITQDTKLDRDLLCPDTAFVIGADNVTLDLGGHLVSGELRTVTQKFQCEEAGGGIFQCTPCDEPGSPPCGPPFATPGGYVEVFTDTTGPAIGIDDTGGFDGVRVRNGRVADFFDGVRFEHARSFRVTDITVPGECPPGFGENCGRFFGCVVCLQDSNGGRVSGTGDVSLLRTSRSVINETGPISEVIAVNSDHNTFKRLAEVLLFDGSDYNVVEGMDGTFVATNAVLISESSGNVVRHNRLNTAQAIALDPGANDNLIEHNVLTGAYDFLYNIAVLGASGNVIRHNRISDPLQGTIAGGIGLCRGSSRNVIEHNRISDTMVGVNLGLDSSCSDTDPPMRANIVRGNRITDTSGFGGELETSGDGIMVGPVARNTLVKGNQLRRNSGNGVTIRAPSTRVARNRAIRNGGFGIWAPLGAIDLGGNRASGNGDPAQCVGVSCSRRP